MIRPTDRRLIPDYTMAALRRYIDQRIPTGHFLGAVLRNDLRGAVNHADDSNIAAIPAIVCWLWNEAPGTCWGSNEAVDAWIAGSP